MCPSEFSSRMKTVRPLIGVLKSPSLRMAAPISARMSSTAPFMVRWLSGIRNRLHSQLRIMITTAMVRTGTASWQLAVARRLHQQTSSLSLLRAVKPVKRAREIGEGQDDDQQAAGRISRVR